MSVAPVDSVSAVAPVSLQSRSTYETVAVARGMQEHALASRERQPQQSAPTDSYDPASANNGRNASDTDIINQTAAERRDAEHEQEAEPEQLDSAVNQANETMAMRNRSIRFRVHSDNNKIQIQVYDPNKDKVLLSIPSDEMIALSTRMRELSGMAVGSVVDLSQ